MCTIEERAAQSTDHLKVTIVAQGGNVFSPIFHNVQGAGCMTLTQSVGGKVYYFIVRFKLQL